MVRFIYKIFFLIFFLFSVLSCNKDTNTTSDIGVPLFAKGADVSWLTEMEADGRKFYTAEGKETDCLVLLKSKGMNAVRLRVWVNPADLWCSTQDMLEKALRAQVMGLRIMIDFHYSDWWADPGKQTKPAAWASMNFSQLVSTLSSYTINVLSILKQNGIAPEWVQVGNETGDGMLWEEGRASVKMQQFATLVNTGYNAVKTVFPKTKVIVHLQNGYDNALYRWLFDGLKQYGAQWDVVGMSLYPSVTNWHQMNEQCLANMEDMISRYGTSVMICEVGMPWDSPEDCRDFLTEIITKVKSLPGNKGLGVFYWEPECSANWNGYTLGAFDSNGKPTSALDAFR